MDNNVIKILNGIIDTLQEIGNKHSGCDRINLKYAIDDLNNYKEDVSNYYEMQKPPIIYEEHITVPKYVYDGLIENHPTAYLDNYSGIERIEKKFSNGNSVSIELAPTFELEDDLVCVLKDQHGLAMNKSYYDEFQNCWVVTNPYIHEIYKLYTEVEG